MKRGAQSDECELMMKKQKKTSKPISRWRAIPRNLNRSFWWESIRCPAELTDVYAFQIHRQDPFITTLSCYPYGFHLHGIAIYNTRIVDNHYPDPAINIGWYQMGK